MKQLLSNKKSKLNEQQKGILAAFVLHQVLNKAMDEKEAGKLLRAELSSNWSVLSAAQYLTGKKAIYAINLLPENQIYRGLSKEEILRMVGYAHHFCANAHLGGIPLSAGVFVKLFKQP